MRSLEELTVRPDDERKFISAAMGQDLTQVSDELEGIVPRQTSRQLSMKQVLSEHRQPMMEMLAHGRKPPMLISPDRLMFAKCSSSGGNSRRL